MLVPDFIFSIIIAMLISFIASLIISRKGPRKGFLGFFFLIFLGTWAGGVWSRAFGLTGMMQSWLPFLLSAIAAAVIFSLIMPKQPKIGRKSVLERKSTLEILEDIEQQREVQELTYISINVIFWVVALLLFAAIILKYI